MMWVGWTQLALLTGARKDLDVLAAMLGQMKFTWAEADATVSVAEKCWPGLTRRGVCTSETEDATGFMCAEYVAWASKCAWVLVAAEPGVSVDEVMASLPTPSQLAVFYRGGYKNSITGTMGWGSLVELVALVCEKFGRYEEALVYCEGCISHDYTQLGTLSSYTHVMGYRLKGRCLVQLGRLEEAAVAFEAAVTLGAEVGLHLHELLALAELQSYVKQEKTGQMKLAVRKMLGPSPTAAQLESLAMARLPPGVSLDVIMAG